jgi:diguanylate cyclase (GGDEF)-like protein
VSDSASNKTIRAAISPAQPGIHADAYLVVIYGTTGLDLGKKYNLAHQSLTVGRSAEADIQINQEEISRNHCKIVDTGQAVFVRDLGSTNGTCVNDELVGEHILRDGDFIKIGRCIFKFLSGNNIESAYHEEIYRLTTVDGLTQVFNKLYFLETLEREMKRAERYRRDLSLIMLDIDHFKNTNDVHGHLAGDNVLKQLALLLKREIRSADILARYGGEEFSIILPEIDTRHALEFGERIRRLIERETFRFKNTVIPITISVGVAQLTSDLKNTDMFIHAADENLYEAKNTGRNRVVG